METQTMTFSLRGMTERQAYFYAESLRLGISEFDGIVRRARMQRSVAGEYVLFCTWKDVRSVERFRHSEVYARFALSTNVTDLCDTTETIGQFARPTVTEDMIALAA